MIKKSKSKKCTVCDKIISIYRESVGCAGYKQKILDSEGGVFWIGKRWKTRDVFWLSFHACWRVLGIFLEVFLFLIIILLSI